MTEYFMDEEILARMAARLVSYNSLQYDCESDVILTKNFLYVQEDNYNGTYDCHLKIPMINIVSIKKYVLVDGKEIEQKDVYMSDIYDIFISICSGAGPFRIRDRKAFLRIDVQDKDKNIDSIFLTYCRSKDIKKMIRAFNEYKTFYR